MEFEMHSKDNSEYVQKDEIKKLKKKYKNRRKKMKKKKVEYLCYEARFWYVKTLDLADLKYVIIYPLALFSLEIRPFKNGQKRHFRPNLEDSLPYNSSVNRWPFPHFTFLV